MDVHTHNSRTLHYGLNNGRNLFSEDDLQFLSLEERECILFFEETIGSVEEDDERTGMPAVERPASYTQTAQQHHPPVDHDIIDLVHPTPNPNKHKDPSDFQELPAAPETRQAKRDPLATLPVSVAPPEDRQQPLTASAIIGRKLSEPESVSLASQLLQRRSSLEFPQNPSVKHGPPTHAKPTRLPNSVGVLLGSRDSIPHSIAAEAVSVQEQRAQVLSSLSGSAHPLDGGEPSCVRKLPLRSISFRDPTPDKSRMEALSKLGLDQRRTQSIMYSSPRDSERVTTPALKNPDVTDHCQTRRTQPIMHSSPRDSESAKTPALKSNPDVTDHSQTRRTQPIMHCSPRDSESAKTPALKSNFPANASADARTADVTDHYQPKSSPAPNLTSAEVTHSDFNSYGGKSITLHPTMPSRTEPVSASSPKTEVHLNNSGGRPRAITSPEANHGVRTKTFFPGKEDNSSSNRTANQGLPKRKASHSEAPPTPAPRPLRPTGSQSRTRSPETRRTSFRAQGITVQFSGRGATDEARRNALRKLGLLRDSP